MNAKTEKKGELAVVEGTAIAAQQPTDEQWQVLRKVIFPSAQSDDSIRLAWDYCMARKLDPLKRVVHVVAVWDKEQKKLVDTIWPGIAELRTTASRTGAYAGKDEPDFGPDVEKELGTQNVTFPEWCKITVYRIVQGHRVGFTGIVYWEEAYASLRDGTPNAMWMKRKRGQLAKCAEAEALRAAFPEEIGGEYAAEEMSGQTINDAAATSKDGVFDARAAEDGERPQRVIDAESQDVTSESEPEPEKPEPAQWQTTRARGEPIIYDSLADWRDNTLTLIQSIETAKGLRTFHELNGKTMQDAMAANGDIGMEVLTAYGMALERFEAAAKDGELPV